MLTHFPNLKKANTENLKNAQVDQTSFLYTLTKRQTYEKKQTAASFGQPKQI